MSTLTIGQLFYDAYRDAGIPGIMHQSGLNPDQVEEARTQYNRMIDTMELDGGTISHVARLLFNLVPNKGDYTLGPNGDLDPAAPANCSNPGYNYPSASIASNYPVRLQRASMVLSTQNYAGAGPPEYKLFPLTLDEWQAWTLKGQSTNFPRHYFYEPSFPLATFHLLYVPTENDQLALYIDEVLANIDAASDAILQFRPGYQDLLTGALAMRLSDRYPEAQIKPGVIERTREARDYIRMNNNRPLSKATDMSAGSRFRSNIYNGNRYNQ